MVKENLEQIILCVNHLINIVEPYPKKEGWGDCYTCIPDPKENQKCLGYKPIKIFYMDVKK